MSYKNDMKEAAAVGSVLGLATIVYVLFWVALVGGLGYVSYLAYSFYAPRYEQVRYNTFKQSQTYNDGMIRDLQNLKMDYLKANDEQKAALKAITIHRFSVYDTSRLPPDLKSFYDSLTN